MRIARTLQLHSDTGFVHKYWKCHNHEFLLASNESKSEYLAATRRGLLHYSNSSVFLHAYCVMDNHSHQLLRYENGSQNLSSFMRAAHSQFGQLFNRKHKRSGKVANERPKTPLIENYEHAVRVHMYIEANPIRAKQCTFENLKRVKHCSFRFFGYGIKDEFSTHIDIPTWYEELGKTQKDRQRAYRRLFRKYLDEDLPAHGPFFQCFIGSDSWILQQVGRVQKCVIKNNHHVLPSG